MGIHLGQNNCDRKYHDVTLAPAAAGRKMAPTCLPPQFISFTGFYGSSLFHHFGT